MKNKTRLTVFALMALLGLSVVGAAVAHRYVVIRGRHGNDTVDGGLGNDRLWVGHGADIENGGEGDDVLHALANDDLVDTLDCGPGNDKVWLNSAESDVHVNCEQVRVVTSTNAD